MFTNTFLYWINQQEVPNFSNGDESHSSPAAKQFNDVNMKNLEIKKLEEKDELNADSLISLGKSRKASIEPVKMRKS